MVFAGVFHKLLYNSILLERRAIMGIMVPLPDLDEDVHTISTLNNIIIVFPILFLYNYV